MVAIILATQLSTALSISEVHAYYGKKMKGKKTLQKLINDLKYTLIYYTNKYLFKSDYLKTNVIRHIYNNKTNF